MEIGISQIHEAAWDQLSATFIHAWEQELSINWLAGVCALPWMLLEWDWLLETLHGEGRIGAKRLEDLKENIRCSMGIFLSGPQQACAHQMQWVEFLHCLSFGGRCGMCS